MRVDVDMCYTVCTFIYNDLDLCSHVDSPEKLSYCTSAVINLNLESTCLSYVGEEFTICICPLNNYHNLLNCVSKLDFSRYSSMQRMVFIWVDVVVVLMEVNGG